MNISGALHALHHHQGELSLSARDAVSGGKANFAALNPQPIPPGRLDLATLNPQPLPPKHGPGCPGPLASNFAALNPQPIPPGRLDWATLNPQPLPPNPCRFPA